MKKLLHVILLVSVAGFAQDKNVISVELKTVNGNQAMTLNYFSLEAAIGFPQLPKGKHRFYIVSDENCVPMLYRERGYKFSDEEARSINGILARHRMAFVEDGVTVVDCEKFSNRTIPVTVTID